MELKQINNPFEQEMIDSGFIIHKANDIFRAIRIFQKRITDEKGTKYFITCYHYNHAKQLNRADIQQEDSYQFDSQFRFDKNGKDYTVNVKFWGDNLPNQWRPPTTLKETEEFFEKFFIEMKPDYYELYG